MALVTAALVGFSGFTAAANAVEDIQITYGDLEAPPISLADLEEFARTGMASRDLQMLLTLLRIDETKARDLLVQEIPVDVESLREMSDSFIGQFLWRMISTTISTTDEAGEAWQLMQEAVLKVAASGRITILDVLRNFNATVLRIDSQRVLEIASQMRPEDIRLLSSIFLGE
ncbi:MAG: alpha/beta hydrolase [Leptolyngbyaceae cyanobacterium SM2_5_2]|nr:alpha/beta hydrolase [Leptolyngbyaceae cyanobacterium SM2_5_2]